MKVFVTGSKGKVGVPTVAMLKEAGHEVVEYDLQDGWDILDTRALLDAMSGCEVVVHLAGIPGPVPEWPFTKFFRINAEGTLSVMEATQIAGVKRVVYSGSTAFYGKEPGIPCKEPVTEGDAPFTCLVDADALECQPQHLRYDISKIIAEQIVAYYGLRQVVEVVVLRYGPLKAGRGSTPQTAARANVLAVEHPGPWWYEVFNIVDEEFDWADASKAREVLFA